MHKPDKLVDKRCGNCDALMFKASTGTTRIEHKCRRCGTINIIEGIAESITLPIERRPVKRG
jgi:phage FluMu protein Com